MTAVRTLGAAVLISILAIAASLSASDQPADTPFVDGPLGPAVILPPDPSRPIDTNNGS